MKLYAHQQKIVDKRPARSLLCWETGTGKSLAAMTMARDAGGGTLVVVPKALREKWKRDMRKHGGKQWAVVSKEEFRRDWKKIPANDNLIIDEAHYFSGMKSGMTKALYGYTKVYKPSNVWLLTATAYMSTPWNIYVLARHLGHRWNYIGFKQRFFFDIRMGNRLIPTIKSGIEDEIAKLVNLIGDVVKLEDCVDVPDQIFENEVFQLTVPQIKAVKELEDFIPIVRFSKIHQIENGTLKSDGYTENQFFKSDKIDRLKELCVANKKIAIVCRYNLQIDYIKEELEGCRDLKSRPIYVIRGDVKDRDAIIRQVDKDSECIILINASCSEGYELPSIGVCVFASLSFSYKDYRQICGRFLRINKLKKNVYIHLIVAGSVDEDVYKAIKRKEDFSIKIYEK